MAFSVSVNPLLVRMIKCQAYHCLVTTVLSIENTTIDICMNSQFICLIEKVNGNIVLCTKNRCTVRICSVAVREC